MLGHDMADQRELLNAGLHPEQVSYEEGWIDRILARAAINFTDRLVQRAYERGKADASKK